VANFRRFTSKTSKNVSFFMFFTKNRIRIAIFRYFSLATREKQRILDVHQGWMHISRRWIAGTPPLKIQTFGVANRGRRTLLEGVYYGR